MTKREVDYLDKCQGMLVGLAVGDAIGAPVEFGCTSKYIRSLGEKLEHFSDSPRCPSGEWTDDTSMALCLADSLIERGGYDSYDIMERFRRWLEEGYRTPDGEPAPDVGFQTRGAIEAFKNYPVISKYDGRIMSAGNGPIMRLAPVVIANARLEDIAPMIKMAELSCRETHDSIAACAITEVFATILYYVVQGLPKEQILERADEWISSEEYANFLSSEVYGGDVVLGKLKTLAMSDDDTELRDLGGYCLHTLTIALWGLMNFANFRDGLLAVIRLGGDTDTNGAVYGQLAGAYYGYSAIPEEWKNGVCQAKELVNVADKLLEMKKCPIVRTRFEGEEGFEYLSGEREMEYDIKF